VITRHQRVAASLYPNLVLDEYSDLYFKTNILLLADIFENFCNNCVTSYGLNFVYYYILPGFTWDAMLKHMRINFELLTDGHVHQMWYMWRSESMFQQVRANQQQVHADI